MQQLNYQPATLGDLVLGHTQRLIEALQEECREGAHEIEHAPTYLTPASFQAALGAVGATLAVSRKVIDEDGGKGFAIVRPPGHHPSVTRRWVSAYSITLRLLRQML